MKNLLGGAANVLLSRYFIATAGIALILGCAISRAGQFDFALEHYNKGEYAEAIRNADGALHTGTPSSEDRARAILIKAHSYEQLGETASAVGLYEYLLATFPDSPEAYQSRESLRHLQRTGVSR